MQIRSFTGDIVVQGFVAAVLAGIVTFVNPEATILTFIGTWIVAGGALLAIGRMF
jgi:hypothetical protein